MCRFRLVLVSLLMVALTLSGCGAKATVDEELVNIKIGEVTHSLLYTPSMYMSA